MNKFILADAWDYEKNCFYEILIAVDQILSVCQAIGADKEDDKNEIYSGVKLKKSGSLYHCKQDVSYFIERLT